MQLFLKVKNEQVKQMCDRHHVVMADILACDVRV